MGSTMSELKIIEVNGKKLSARISGVGAPIVLFHSLLADGTSFDPIVQELSKTHQTIILNLPGFGESEFVGGNLNGIADHIAKGIELLHLSEKPIFLGNGYGGFIALITSIRHPELPARLVLADCGAAFSEPGRAAFKMMSATAREKGLSAIANVAMRRLFAPEFQEQNPELIAERKKCFLALDPETFHGACEALSTLDIRFKLGKVEVPVLVLVGEHDEATPPPMSHELNAGLPNSKLVVLTGCAHVPQLQSPPQFLAAIKDFIV
jgi:3-oxoadipate enol-lactonase